METDLFDRWSPKSYFRIIHKGLNRRIASVWSQHTTFHLSVSPWDRLNHYTLAMTLPIGPNDILVGFGPAREALGLPDIYKTPSHPKKSGRGSIYYFIQDLSKAALAAAEELENRLRIPHGPESVAIEMGKLHWPPPPVHMSHRTTRLLQVGRRRHNLCARQYCFTKWNGRCCRMLGNWRVCSTSRKKRNSLTQTCQPHNYEGGESSSY